MKLKFVPKHVARPHRERDQQRTSLLKKKIFRLSIGSRNKQLAEMRAKPLKRDLEVAPSQSPTPAGKTSVTLNVSGNLRGMHNHHNPPESEQMKKIRAMRRFYNRQMPALACNSCAFSNNCPQYKAGYECAFLPYLNAHKVETEKDLLEYMKELVGSNMRRSHLATLQETLAGGKISFETSEALNLAFMQLSNLHKMMNEANQGNISITSDDQSVITRVFGSLELLQGATREAHAKPIDVVPIALLNGIDTKREGVVDSGDKVNEDLVREHSRSEMEHAVGKTVLLKKPEVVVMRKGN